MAFLFYKCQMRTMYDPLRKLVAEKIAKASEGKLQPAAAFEMLVEPPNTDLGDLAFGCFILAKELKKAPPMIAQELKAKFQKGDEIESVEAVGPYLNIKFTPKAIGELLLASVQSGEVFKTKLTEESPKTMIEYSQPNTHKELHVGHMRNACLGNSLVRLLKYANYPIISSTFPGDMGTHVAKCLWYLKFHNKEEIPSNEKGEWLGQLYTKAHLKLEDDVGTPKEKENQAQMSQILKELEGGTGESYKIWQETRQWSIDLMNKVYEWADIHFDQWYWESEVDSSSVQLVKKYFAEGKLQESQGAIGMDLEAEGLGFCLLLKSDGNGLYATKDLELARKKFQDFHIEKNVYVVDQRQALHFKQVFKTLEKLGFEQAKNCYHLQYNFVELPDGAMSSRKGNIVPLTSLIKNMENTIKEQFLGRYKGEWKDSEIDEVATQVAKGAIKYGMLRIDTNKKIVFDMNEWMKIDGESGPFIQYSYARINSLCQKMGYAPKAVKWEILTHVAERKLMQGLMGFHYAVLGAAENYKPSLLCTYLYELAKKFNFFYHECSIGQADTPELKEARLALSFATGQILKKGLELLGIPAPNKM